MNTPQAEPGYVWEKRKLTPKETYIQGLEATIGKVRDTFTTLNAAYNESLGLDIPGITAFDQQIRDDLYSVKEKLEDRIKSIKQTL